MHPQGDAEPGSAGIVLLVDDEAIVRRLVREMLTEGGFTVFEASSGEEALQMVRAQKPAVRLLLTDIIMPHMDGHELAHEICLICPETRVLFMSGYSTDSNARKITAIGGQYIAKPFRGPELMETVHRILAAPWSGLKC